MALSFARQIKSNSGLCNHPLLQSASKPEIKKTNQSRDRISINPWDKVSLIHATKLKKGKQQVK